jgi:hypothetical protein
LQAVDDGVLLASLWFTEYEGEISVKMLESSPEYKKKQKGLGSGVGRILVRELQKLYPGVEIHSGMMTDDGARLLKALPRSYEPSVLHEKLQAKLLETNTEIERLEKIFEDWHNLSDQERELSRDEVIQRTGKLNQLYDQVYKLERMINQKPKGKWLINSRSMILTQESSLVRSFDHGG